ncbi:MAG: L,D-transpeptidase family protein [Acidimicrobiales bacterium]|nr:L,D-transpeptidase family protein [Acidimicrobiales bacterium]MYH75274.1 L,D-transpeptidase family protein [Acidimicrobiales bacterium]MYK71060.1 L,D-transpeptidase family protein [Acidimicrobiales bacterium]
MLASGTHLRMAAGLGVAAALALLPFRPASAVDEITDRGAEPVRQWHLDFYAAWLAEDGDHTVGVPEGVPEAPLAAVVLGPGEYLSAGESAMSPNGWYRLTLEPDGRLVLRATDDGLGLRGILWSTEPAPSAVPLLVMRSDGELVLYDTAHSGFGAAASGGDQARLWSAGTRSEAGASLLLGDDGALSVVAPLGPTLWRSGNSAPDVGLLGARHVIYDRGGQWVWLIDADGAMVDNYPVSGHAESPLPGRYSVTSKSQDAISYNWLNTMEHMVRFTTDSDGDNIGFHSIPRGWRDTPVQTEAELGEFGSLGCVRQRDDKAERLYEWAAIGTPVVVIA